MKNIFLSVCLLFGNGPLYSQSVVIKGRVTDSSGQAVPFASVYQKNTTRGTSANIEGEYHLALAPGPVNIVYKAIGFKAVEKSVNLVKDVVIHIELEPAVYELGDVTVRAFSEDPAYEVIKNAIRKRKQHLNEVPKFTADVYIKGMQKLLAAPKKFLGKDIDEIGSQLGLDSNRAGILYLSESESKLSFIRPDQFREEMVSSKVSGSNRAFSFNRASDLKVNFYENLLDLGGLSNRPFVSPIAENALFYYAYRLIGTTVEDGQMVNKIQVIPKREADPVFRGIIYILEDSWRIHSTDLYLTKDANINFIDTLNLRQQFSQVSSRLWMPSSVRYDFKGGVFGFRFGGYYIALFKNYDLEPEFNKRDFKEVLKITRNVNNRDSTYWSENRPIPLTDEEKGDYKSKEKLAAKRESKVYLDSLDRINNKFKPISFVFTSGYDHRNRSNNEYLNFPSLLSSIFYNTVEGFGANYRVSYSKRIDSLTNKFLNLSGKLRYGAASERLNGVLSGSVPVKQAYFSFSVGSDVLDLNNQGSISLLGNSVNSLLYERNFLKLYEKQFVNLGWSQRLGSVQTSLTAEYAYRKHLQNSTDYKIKDWENRTFTSNNPFSPQSDLTLFPENQAVKLGFRATYSFSNKYSTYPSGRYYVPSKYPRLGVTYTMGLKGIFGSDVNYNHISADLSKSGISMGLYGSSAFWLGAGKFLGSEQLYFVDRKHFVGNRSLSYIPKDNSFLFLDFYQHSTSGSYFEGHLSHNFSGFLLNKIPLVRRLKLQEIAGVNYLNTSELKHYSEAYFGLQYLTFKVMYGMSFIEGSRQDRGIRIAYGF